MTSKDKTKKIILYILNSLGSKIEGKKKLMKLMFLIEHYDLSSDKLNPSGFLGNNFKIYFYGVFSSSIMRSVQDLIDEKKIKEGFPLVLIDRTELVLEEGLRKRVDGIINKFGNNSGYKLEVSTLGMLNIQPHEKGEYFGQEIGTILKNKTTSN